MKGGLFGLQQSADKKTILGLGQRAVDIVIPAVVVAGGPKGPGLIDGFGVNNRGNGIIEMQMLPPQERGQRGGQFIRRQRAGGQYQGSKGREFFRLPGNQLNARIFPDLLGDESGEPLPVHSQRFPGRDPGGPGRRHHQRPQEAHLLLEQPHGVARIIGPQGIAADQFRQIGRMMRRGISPGFHIPQRQVDPPAGGLPGRLAARQTGADDQQFIGWIQEA